VRHRAIGLTFVVGAATLSLATWGCAGAPRSRPIPLGKVETGAGSLEATRRALDGQWTLVSLDVVDAGGARRPIKASGRLTYDAFGTMSVRGVIEDAALRDTLVIDYTGRIVIDVVRHEFYPADLVTDRPVDPDQIVAIAPDKVRRYELSGDSLAVTYLDRSAKPTAVIRWRRQAP
jgi:hypothetical protein